MIEHLLKMIIDYIRWRTRSSYLAFGTTIWGNGNGPRLSAELHVHLNGNFGSDRHRLQREHERIELEHDAFRRTVSL